MPPLLRKNLGNMVSLPCNVPAGTASSKGKEDNNDSDSDKVLYLEASDDE